jgi:hexosaminidase
MLGAVAFVLVCFTALSPAKADNPQPPQLRLVPTPRNVKLGDGAFKPAGSISIAAGADDGFAAQQLIDEIKADLGQPAQLSSAAPSIILKRDRADLPDEATAEGYVLTVTPAQITITAPSDAGIFYGTQTLKQLFRANLTSGAIPACTITDWPVLKYRAWQDDISRGPIPTLDYLKREIRTMSEFKENAFTLYTEHVFKLKKHPDISPPDTITAEEIKQLADYAKQYHVDLWGNYQSFGHQAHMFSLPQYAEMGDHGWAFDPAREKTYTFLKDVYSEIATAYPSPFFCISCDEVGGFTNDDAVALIKQIGPGAFYAQHINRVADLLKPYNKTPMMWGDIALQHPEDIPKLPKNLIILPWTYGDSGNYDRWLKPYVSSGYTTIVCPGVNCWNRMYPDVGTAVANISDFTRDGVRYHTLGQLNTMWRDDGETLFGYCYYPLVWGAETAWSPVGNESGEKSHAAREARVNQFDNAFDGVFYGLPGSAVAAANHDLGSKTHENKLAQDMADHTFWKDPILAWQEKDSVANAESLVVLTQHVIQSATAAQSRARYNADTLDFLSLAARRTRFLALKVLLVDGLQRRANLAPQITSELPALRAEFVRLWNSENRQWSLASNLEKYDALATTINSLPNRVIISPLKSEFANSLNVELKSLGKGAVHYTLDGTEPIGKSPLYSGPITITRSTVIKARNFMTSAQPGPVSSATYTTSPVPAKASIYKMNFYQDHTPGLAFDGSDSTFFWSDGPPHFNSSLTVTLDAPATFKHVIVHTGHPDDARDKLQHGKLEIVEPGDNKKWEDLGDFKDGQYDGALPTKPIKAIRIHVMADQDQWLVIREIVLQ